MLTSNRRYLPLFICILLTACSTSPVNLSAGYDTPSKYKQKRLGRYSTCTLGVNNILDQRSSKGLGHVAGRMVTQDQIESWIRQGYVETDNLAVDFVDDADPAGFIDISVIKLYSRSASTSISSNIVLRVKHFSSHGDALSEKIFRGQVTNMNWSSSANEIKGLFTEALIDVVKQTSDILSSKCG
jgi:hypothetical protein